MPSSFTCGTEGHDDDPPQDDGHDSGFKDGFDDEAKKKRVMSRLLTGRLDKLVAKKDDTCAQFSYFSTF